jgi:signal transduction histidine kinase
MVQAPIRVLLADDTPDIRMLLRASLEVDGRFEIVGEAADGRQAIDIALQMLPDVVLLDLAMPVMDGLQAIGPIASGSPRSKIVILSGFDAIEMAPEALDRGAHAYLEKGASGPQVIDTVIGLLGTNGIEATATEPAADLEPVAPEGIPTTPQRSASEQVDEVLAALVHELMTPLTVIQGFSDTLKQRLDLLSPEMVREASRSISRNAEQMANLIMSFADARSMELNELDLYLESVDLGRFVRQTIGDLASVTGERPVTVDAADGIEVKIDKTRIRQVLQNLITNAVKHTPEPSAIDVGVAAAGSAVEVWVSDHGPGIPVAAQEAIFTKFTQLDERSKGAGLGLYIARTIALAHGGDVTVAPAASGGARFTLLLPARS